MSKIGIAITMYDEHDLVLSSVRNIRALFSDTAKIVIVHSDNGKSTANLDTIKDEVDRYYLMSDLGKIMSRHEYPACAISRNYSKAFQELYSLDCDYEFIVAFTGDTLIFDAANFIRRFNDMKRNNWSVMVSQVVGFKIHASTDDPARGITGNRPQTDLTTDFAPQLFFIEGAFAKQSQVFADIPITNKFGSEQCLGDELCRALEVQTGEEFHRKVSRLNTANPRAVYSYCDGTRYHAKNTEKPGR